VYESVGSFSEAHRILLSMAGDEGQPREATRSEVQYVDLISDDDDTSGDFAASPRRSSPRRRGSHDDDCDGAAASGKCLNLKRRRTLSRGVAPKPTKRSKAGFFVKLQRLFSNMRRMWNNLDAG